MKSIQYSIIILIIIIIIFLSGCSSETKKEILSLEYNEKQYHFVRNWEMINKESYVTDIAIRNEKEYKVCIYSDSQKRFIFDEYYQLLYHKEEDSLPNFKEAEGIEKIEIVFSDININKIELDEESIIKEVVTLMSKSYNEYEFKNNSPFKKTIASMNVYFKDYPAYHSVVSVIEAKDGSYGFIMFDWWDFIKVGDCDYITVPVNSQIINILNK